MGLLLIVSSLHDVPQSKSFVTFTNKEPEFHPPIHELVVDDRLRFK